MRYVMPAIWHYSLKARALSLTTISCIALLMTSHAIQAQELSDDIELEPSPITPQNEPLLPNEKMLIPEAGDNSLLSAVPFFSTEDEHENTPQKDTPTLSEEENHEESKARAIQSGKLAWKASLMFSLRDIKNLERVLMARDQAEKYGPEASDQTTPNVNDFVNKLLQDLETTKAGNSTPTPARPLPTSAPAFYLSSIVWVDSDNWSVWINGIRYSPDKPAQNITITQVTPERISFTWQSEDLDYISPNWQSSLPIKDSKQGSDSTLSIDASTRTVWAILEPNQTLITRSMRIVEGHVDSTPLRNSSGGQHYTSPQQPIMTQPTTPLEGLVEDVMSDENNSGGLSLKNIMENQLGSNEDSTPVKEERATDKERDAANSLMNMYKSIGNLKDELN